MKMNDAISYTLRTGVIASLLLVVIGVALLFADNGSNGFTLGEMANAHAAVNPAMFSATEIIQGIFAYQGADFILLGLIVLIATPVVRVLMSVFAFVYGGNRLYAVITIVVFVDLMVAVFVVPGMLAH